MGSGEPLDIVCGATNIAPGQRVPVALPGAVLPGNRRIERTEKMGVVSNGMLCSGDELNLTTDADGILILPSETPIGTALVDLYGDVVLDVDVKPNRGDALCLVGLAREVSAATGAPVHLPPTDVVESGGPVAERLAVEVLDPDLCARFVGRWVSDVTIGPSPDPVQMRLQAAGMRPVSNVVDASNYVMLELGKPIHTFDAAAVGAGEGGIPRIIVRRARAGERIETLDHVDRALDPETLLITDPRGPIGIAGVMGGAESEIGDTTRDVIVESAIFDPVSIRRTAFRYALRSEASLRFEKGQEFRLARLGADRTTRLIVEWSGGVAAEGRIDTADREPPASRVAFRPSRVNRLLGTELPAGEQRDLLARVGVETEDAPPDTDIQVAAGARPLSVPSEGAAAIVAVVPTWRRDIAIEADVAEEIARVRGYELVPSVTPDTADARVPAFSARGARRRPRHARRSGTGRGGHPCARVAAHGRDLPGGRYRADASRRDGGWGRTDLRDEPALEPALCPAPLPRRKPARRRWDEPAPGTGEHCDLRDRQGLRPNRDWGGGARFGGAGITGVERVVSGCSRGDDRMVAARVRPDRTRPAAASERARPAVGSR